MRRLAAEMLNGATRIRTLFPHAAAMRAVELPDVPPAEFVTAADAGLYAAVGYVRDEAVAVQSGLVTTVDVLDEELDHLRQALAAAGPARSAVTPVATHVSLTLCCRECGAGGRET